VPAHARVSGRTGPGRVARMAGVALVAALAVGACGTSSRPSLQAASSTTVGKHLQTQTTPPPTTCSILNFGQSLVATASHPGALAIYTNPGDATPSQTMNNPYLINNNPKAPVPLTFLVKDFPPAQACQWLNVYLPIRPDGSTGWVKASDVTTAANPWRLEADLAEFTLKVFKDGQQVDTIKIGVAKANTPTPGGIYYLTELIKTPNPNGDYGPFAYGLSGYSNALTSFNGGPGQLGLHGTNEPQLIGTQVSHGCIRMNNADITRLAGELPLGTPIQIDT
jgi:lipoprotein-anchoring transpeptidase ErfK/SrfK